MIGVDRAGASVILSLPLGFWHFLSLFGHSMAWAVSWKVLAHTLHTYAQLLGSPVIGWRFGFRDLVVGLVVMVVGGLIPIFLFLS